MPAIRYEVDAAVIDNCLVESAAVVVEGDRVVAAGPSEDVPTSSGARREPVRGTLLPGAIDLQVNGAGGCGVDEATPEALDCIAETVLAGGATAFLPTLITAPIQELTETTARVASWIESWSGRGAEPLGIHLEGPFLEVAGAHDPGCFVAPAPELVETLLHAAAGRLSLVTLAPGLTGAIEATRRLVEAGVCVSIGHARDDSRLGACVDAGASLVTHLFNAMSPMHHRAPGIAGHAQDDPRLSCSMILDGVHVDPVVVRNAWRNLGAQRLVLITDAVSAAGMPDGDYTLGSASVRLESGVVRDGEGRLAGAALLMTDAARNFRSFVPTATDVDLARVVSTNAARLLSDHERGTIGPGSRAQFSVWTPEGGLKALAVR